MVSLEDALISTETQDQDSPSAQESQPRVGLAELDALFIYRREPQWISSVAGRLEARGWRVHCINALQAPPSFKAVTVILIGLESHDLQRYAIHGGLCCVLPSHVEGYGSTHPKPPQDSSPVQTLTPQISSPTSAHHKEIRLVNQLTQTVEQLIHTGYSLQGTHTDPRLERASREAKHILESAMRPTHQIDHQDEAHAIWSHNAIDQLCDVVASAFNADLAYGELQAQHALLMYIELHQELCNYAISTHLCREVRSQFWYQVCAFLLHMPQEPVSLDLSAQLYISGHHKRSAAVLSDSELMQSKAELISDLAALKDQVRHHEPESAQVKSLINSYRLRWEHLLIARHTAKYCNALDRLVDTLASTQWGRHEVIQILISTEESIIPLVQSGYMRGALNVYTHVITRLNEHISSLYDPQVVAGVHQMMMILQHRSESPHDEVLDIFGRIKDEVELLITTHQDQDLDEVINISSSKST